MRTADTLWLENAGLKLGIDARNGALLALTDRATGQGFVEAQGATGIWRLDRLGSRDSEVVPSAARRFSWHELAGVRPGLGSGLALVWSDFGLNEAPGTSLCHGGGASREVGAGGSWPW